MMIFILFLSGCYVGFGILCGLTAAADATGSKWRRIGLFGFMTVAWPVLIFAVCEVAWADRICEAICEWADLNN